MRSRLLALLIPAAFALAACGGGNVSTPAATTALTSQPPATSDAPSAGPGGGDGAITIGTDTGEALVFDPTEVTAPAGVDLTITFENRSTVPHNLTFGEPINVATSAVVAAGASEDVEVPALEAGDYEFVCTLHPGMEGTLTVEGA